MRRLIGPVPGSALGSTLAPGILAVLAVLGGVAAGGTSVSELRPRGQSGPDDFGTSCAADGDLLIVGDPVSGDGEGAVYVFGRLAGRWVQRQRIATPERGGADEFGASVGVLGERILVGAPGTDAGAGAAYLYDYDRIRSVWALTERLDAAPPVTGGRLGEAVGIDDGTLFASAPAEDRGAGAVYVFTETLPDVWTQQSRVTPTQAEAGAVFGKAIAAAGGALVVGAPGEAAGDGAVYVFVRSGRNWLERLRQAGASGGGAALGSAVATDGLTVAGAEGTGAVNVFSAGPDGFAFDEQLVEGGSTAFGRRVAVAQDVLAVTDPGADAGAGVVHVYRRVGLHFVAHGVFAAAAGAADYGAGLAAHDDAVFIGAAGGRLAEGLVDVVDLRDRVAGYRAATSATFRGGAAKTNAWPGITWDGVLDLGPDPVALTGVTVIRIGDTAEQIQALDQAAPGRPATHDDGTLRLRIVPDRKGSSRARFSLVYTGDLSAAGLSADGPLHVEFQTEGFAAAGEVRLAHGAFSASTGAASIVSPAVSVEKLKVAAKGAGKSRFAFTARFPTDGLAPESGPNVVVRYGDDFEERIDGKRFKVKKTKARYANGKASGVTRLVVDFRKGLVRVTAKHLDLTPAAPGPVPISVGVTVNGLGGDAAVTAVAKGKKLTR